MPKGHLIFPVQKTVDWLNSLKQEDLIKNYYLRHHQQGSIEAKKRMKSLVVCLFVCFFLCVCVCVCVCACVRVCVCVSIISSSVNGHLGCIHILVNNASVNIGVYMSFWISVSVFYICPGVELLGHMRVLFLDFEKTPYCKILHLQGFERLYLLRFDVFKGNFSS